MRWHNSFLYITFLLSLLSWLSCQSTHSIQDQPCQTNDQCSVGLKCLGGRCGDGREGSFCRRSVDCVLSFQCSDNRCRQKGKEDTTFESSEQREKPQEARPDTTYEKDALESSSPEQDIDQNLLGQACRKHEECVGGQVCLLLDDRLTARCSALPSSCTKESDCSTLPGTHCRFLNLPAPHSSGLYCLHPFYSKQKPRPAGELCTQHDECQSQHCLNQTMCGAFCKQDTDCPSQFYCGTYTYFQKGDVGGCRLKCKTDRDCPSGTTCNNQRRCVAQNAGHVGSACQSQSECNQGKCLHNWRNGYCTQVCNPTLQKCGTGHPDCPKTQRCQSLPGLMGEKRCVSTCTDPKARCILQSATQGYCLKTCMQNVDCRSDYFCTEKTAQTPSVCFPRGQQQLGESCEDNAQCESGLCKLFPSGRYCSQPCKSQPCPIGYQCNTWKHQKLCEKRCIQNSHCADGYTCVSQRCELSKQVSKREIGEACQKDDDCKENRCIKDDPLYPHGYCSASCGPTKGCPKGSLCVHLGRQNICVKSCLSDSMCQRKNYFCFQLNVQDKGNQLIPCHSQKLCPNGAPFPVACTKTVLGSFCSTGICLGRGPRVSGQSCTSSFQCHSGFCYTAPPRLGPPCTDNTLCPSAQPRCAKSLQRCVECTAHTDCPSGRLCMHNRCIHSGYCTQPCGTGTLCPPSTQTNCTPLNNAQRKSMGTFCTPECTSDLQCSLDFSCREHANKKSCQ